ncbi:MAG: DUF3369 domain-containing protein [Pseudodesulfovibrio sp.]
MSTDSKLIFAEETPEEPKGEQLAPAKRPWKLLVVDDDEFVHKVTTMVLRDYRFEDRGLEIISAYSGEEGKTTLRENPDTAVILLDVVMETPQAGLDMAAWIRDELGNNMVRIILRTGQPGEAPEQEVIFKYDINDYKEKAELTSQKLTTTVTAAIRSYRDLRTIERNREGLARIVTASPTIFKTQSMGDFASGVLTQLASTISHGDDSLMARASGLAATSQDGEFTVIASTGKYENMRDAPVHTINDTSALAAIKQAITEKKSFFSPDAFVGYYKTVSGSESVIYLHGADRFRDNDQKLIEVFSSNISVAFDNIGLNQVITETQKELLFTLGEVVETRSSETANHVRRVAEYSYILGRSSGMSQDEAERLKLASPMHDVGKIGIPDAILLKPGKLTDEEFTLVKTHTTIGYDILKKSDRPIMQMAATVALEHHERWDGTGYPNGLKGEEIARIARITTLADIFDALGNKRVYKKAWLTSDILNYLEEHTGTIFDPTLVALFMENLDQILDIKNRFTNEIE